jgi:hypothetical protein
MNSVQVFRISFSSFKSIRQAIRSLPSHMSAYNIATEQTSQSGLATFMFTCTADGTRIELKSKQKFERVCYKIHGGHTVLVKPGPLDMLALYQPVANCKVIGNDDKDEVKTDDCWPRRRPHILGFD